MRTVSETLPTSGPSTLWTRRAWKLTTSGADCAGNTSVSTSTARLPVTDLRTCAGRMGFFLGGEGRMGVSGGSHERARGAAAGRRREEADLRGEQARGHHDGARVRELRGGALGPSGRG